VSRPAPHTPSAPPTPGERALALWRAPETSPLEAAKGGTLVILDAQALPPEVQSYLSEPALGLVVAVPQTVDALVATGQMGERLADRLGDRAVALPALAARAEDLRALALDHLARIGTRLRGKPLGLDLKALQAILDHPWPGNDAEMGAVLLRAALVARGDVIGERELAAIGFHPEQEDARTVERFDHDSDRKPSPTRRRRRG
jgi:DNA-binding NtrC family response regulator